MSAKVTLLTLPEWTWDKLVAAYVKIRCYWPTERVADPRALIAEGRLEILFGQDKGALSDAIDIDVLQDYKQRGLGSATEKVVLDHGLTDEALPGIEHLVMLLRENNATGNLRNHQGSLVLLLRLVWKVNRNEDLEKFRLRIVATFWPVMLAYFEACERDLAKVLTMNPFTIEGYARMLQIVGRDDADIAEACKPFARLTQQSQTRTKQAQTRAEAIEADEFTIGMVGAERLPANGRGPCFTKQVTGHIIHTDDSRVAPQYFRTHPEMVMLVIFAKSSGNCCIQCRGEQDLARMCEALNELEPGLWFHETRPESPMVMRGSPMRPVRKDEVKIQTYQIVFAIKEHFRYRSRRQHELDAARS